MYFKSGIQLELVTNDGHLKKTLVNIKMDQSHFFFVILYAAKTRKMKILFWYN